MNSFKTPYLKISFETNTMPTMYIEHIVRACGEYTECYSIREVESCVRDHLDTNTISTEDAIKVMHKACTFFLR
jgi:hypothetical protein